MANLVELAPRISGFCNPGSNGSKNGVYGLGCGLGTCSADGSYCMCWPGYTHSSYLMTFPDCWDPVHARLTVLPLLAVIFFLNGVTAVFLSIKTTKRVRSICIDTALGSFCGIGVPITLLFQGYFSLLAAFFLGISSLFNLGAVSLLFMATFDPIRQMGMVTYLFKRVKLVHFLAIQSVLLSVGMFFVWVPAYVSAVAGDWYFFNRRALAYFWATGLGFLLLIALPYMFVFRVFERAIRDYAENKDLNVTPNTERQRERTKQLIGIMKTIKNGFFGCGLLSLVPAIYSSAFYAQHRHVPLNNMMFVLTTMGMLSVAWGNNIFCARVIINGKSKRETTTLTSGDSKGKMVVDGQGGSRENNNANNSKDSAQQQAGGGGASVEPFVSTE